MPYHNVLVMLKSQLTVHYSQINFRVCMPQSYGKGYSKEQQGGLKQIME